MPDSSSSCSRTRRRRRSPRPFRGGGGGRGRRRRREEGRTTPARPTSSSKKHPDAAATTDDPMLVSGSDGQPPRRSRATRLLLVLVGCAAALAIQHPWVGRLVEALLVAGAAGNSPHDDDDDDDNVSDALTGDSDVVERDSVNGNREKRQGRRSTLILDGDPGELRPRDLPGPDLFDGFDADEKVLVIDGGGGGGGGGAGRGQDDEEGRTVTIRYRQGRVLQINRLAHHRHPPVFSTVTRLSQLVPIHGVQPLVAVLEGHADALDADPDTVDGMPTYEVFVDSVELRNKAPTNKVRDDPRHRDANREQLRATLQKLTEPYVQQMTQLVRAIHPDLCNVTLPSGERRFCTPCYSLIRRYRHGERISHPPHYDGHARVTVVVSLSEYGNDYTGGLYVATGHGPQREFLNLTVGDAVLHPSTLLHGVHVYPSSTRPAASTVRWSWIVWFRDSETCEDHSLDWFLDCAEQGNPLCLQFQASKVVHQYTESEIHVRGDPNAAQLEASRRIMDLNLRAARGGAAEAAVKVARAYLKQLPSELEFDADEARRHFQIAIDSHSSEGHYGMAQILVAEASALPIGDRRQHELLREAVAHLERAAASMHAFAAFNVGIAHIYGYGVPRVNMERGVEWLVQSGLPEGLFLASQYAATVGDQSRHDRWLRRAAILGWDQPWRVEARKHTGSGGAAGVDLNLMWPPSVARGGIQPPEL